MLNQLKEEALLESNEHDRLIHFYRERCTLLDKEKIELLSSLETLK